MIISVRRFADAIGGHIGISVRRSVRISVGRLVDATGDHNGARDDCGCDDIEGGDHNEDKQDCDNKHGGCVLFVMAMKLTSMDDEDDDESEGKNDGSGPKDGANNDSERCRPNHSFLRRTSADPTRPLFMYVFLRSDQRLVACCFVFKPPRARSNDALCRYARHRQLSLLYVLYI